MAAWWQKMLVFMYVEVCLYMLQCVTVYMSEKPRTEEGLRLPLLSCGHFVATYMLSLSFILAWPSYARQCKP